MEESFLLKVSKNLLSKYKESISDLVIVLPSRRASLFLSEELSKLISNPIWLPQFFSVDDFFFHINNLQRVNKLELFFDFYNMYSTIIHKPHNIDRCYNWANTLLEDFDDIDKACVNRIDLFSYLSDAKRIENWYLDINDHQTDIEEYLDFFKNLLIIHEQLIKLLLDKGLAYSGLSQRLLAENPDAINTWLHKNKKQKIIFIGLDALTISQEHIIDFLLKNQLCDIFWDIDDYFVKNLKQESGQFLRKYKKKWPGILTSITDEFLNRKREIDIIGATKNINQVKLLSHFLHQKSYNSQQLKRVAIILPNEDLLLSVLESVPKSIKEINITMGYKITHHPILSLFNDILNLQINSRNIKINKQIKTKHYLNKNILQLLYNPYSKLLLDTIKNTLSQDLIEVFRDIDFNYLSNDDLLKIELIKSTPLLEKFFLVNLNNSIELINFFKEIIPRLLEILSKHNEQTVFEEECLFAIESHLQVFDKFLLKTNEKIGLKLFYRLFNQCMSSIKLNFSGEPLRGLQVMGLLESRTIDFDEVFILSANENSLPPSTTTMSFIPFDIKKKFNIRTNLEKDAIYANHFFNLIKRPKKIYVIYDQDLTSFYSGEISRFINQLIYEIKPLPNQKINIREQNSINYFSLEKEVNKTLLKQKDKHIINKLLLLAKKGLSPSTINLYNYCKKKFYFDKILNISTDEIIKNDIDPSKIGLVIHRVLEKLYKPYVNQCLDDKIMISIKNRINSEIQKSLTYHKINDIQKGKNLLAFEAITRIVRNFIQYELELVQRGNNIIIKFLEYKMPLHALSNLTLKQFPAINTNPINLKGYIDRIDIFNGSYRIIDYKTGLVQSSELRCNNVSEVKTRPKVLQLLMYAWLFNREHTIKNKPLLVGLINLRAINFEFQPALINNQSIIELSMLSQFEVSLGKIILEMFDANENFEHSNRDEKCLFCD